MSILYESYTETGFGITCQGDNWYAQIFTATTNYPLTGVTLLLSRNNSPGTLTVSIRAVTGTVPSGADLASGTSNANTLTTDSAGELRLVSLATALALTSGTKYAIVIRISGSNPDNIVIKGAATGTYTGGTGVASANAGVNWTANDDDYVFYTYGHPALAGTMAGSSTATATAPTVTNDVKAEQQKSSYTGLVRVVLTKAGEDTLTYYNTDRLLVVSHIESDDSYTAQIVLYNGDNTFTDVDLRGYTATISWGVTLSDGDHYVAHAPLKVLYQEFSSAPGQLFCALTAIGLVNEMGQQTAYIAYIPAAPTGGTLTNNTGVATGSPITLIQGVNVITVTTAGTFDIDLDAGCTGIAASYSGATVTGSPKALATGANSITVTGTGTIKITIMNSTADTLKDVIVGLATTDAYGYQVYTDIGLVWDSEDSVIDSFVPSNYFKVYRGESRLSKINELLGYSKEVKRLEADGNLHFLNPTVSGTLYHYEYTLQGDHTFFAKAYARAIVIPNFFLIYDVIEGVSGSASDATNTLLLKYKIYYLPVTSTAEAQAVANAMLQRAQLNSQRGTITVPMNIFQRVWEYIQVTDSREGSSARTGNVQHIKRVWEARSGKFQMDVGFGNPSAVIPDASTGIKDLTDNLNKKSQSKYVDETGGYATESYVIEQLSKLAVVIELLANAVLALQQTTVDARIDDALNSGDATTDGVIDAIRDAMIAQNRISAS